jgi:subtilisin family serine protease
MAHRTYLVQKYLDPEGPYKQSLSSLSEPDAFELLVDEPGRVVERRELTEDEAQEVASRAHIKAVSPDYEAKAPEPPEVDASAGERLTAAQVRTLHNINALHERGIRGKGQRIAVIDTGIHETLAQRLGSRLVARESFISGEDWRDNSSDSHGSWCLSVIAAACPEAEIVSIKGLSSASGSGTYSGIIRCVERARALGCHVISMSLGGPASQIMDDAVNAADSAGAMVAVAAGNEQRGATDYRADASSPARASGALCTAAFGSDMLVASFSNHGTSVDLGAIGVYSECADPDIVPSFWSGTSMACPAVAAIAALLRSAGHPKPEAKQALLAGCRDTSEPSWEEGQGFADALSSLLKLTPPEEPASYYPELPRRAKSTIDNVPVSELGDFVMTYKREPIGRFERWRT